jgi:hypothetical protein
VASKGLPPVQATLLSSSGFRLPLLVGQSLSDPQDLNFFQEKVYGVSSVRGGARILCLKNVRREALRQLLALGQYDEYYDFVLNFKQGDADFGGVRIRLGNNRRLDRMGMNRRNLM